MTLGKESLLRKIPSALDRRQALFVEAIRYTIDILDVSYSRLCETLIAMTQHTGDRADVPAHVSAMLDAWTMVDSLNRLRRLVEHFPNAGGKNKSPAYRVFMSVTEKIPELRNTVQHLETVIQGITENSNWAVWGSLSWGTVDPVKNEVTTNIFMPGMPGGSRPMVNPLDRKLWHLPIDSITIERGGVAVSLSDAMRRVVVLARIFEESFSEAMDQILSEEDRKKTAGSDVTITLRMRVTPQQIVPEETPDPDPELPPELDEESSVNVGERSAGPSS